MRAAAVLLLANSLLCQTTLAAADGGTGPSVARPAVRAAREVMERLAVHWVGSEEIKSLLKDEDRRQGLLDQAGLLLEEGRELAVGLKLEEAALRYRRAIEKLEGSFARYYDAGFVAEPVLQLGVVLHQAGRKDEARKAFMRAISLASSLQLSKGYYSPSVREAFRQAREELGELQPGIPLPKEMARICAATGLRGMLVLSAERLGNRQLLRLALFDAGKDGLTTVETVVLDERRATSAGREAAKRIEAAVAELAGIHLAALPPSPNGGMDLTGGGDPDSGPVEPWYVRHWWIWPVAAAVAAAVVLPLTVFREDVVDVRLRY